jgi:predicted transcriptional regulator
MPPSESPTNAELGVLDELWRSPGATVREIANAMHGSATPVQYRTVQVLLQRLEKKGLARGSRGETPHRFTATVGRSELIGDELQRVADKVCDGSLTPLLLSLAEKTRLSAEQRAALWKLLEDE